MRILCLHGRGSNNEIFRMQTAAIRSDLEDFSWEFVQGTVRHTEGNWSLYTTAFSKLPLYVYYNPLTPRSILQTEEELLTIIRENGPFDGVLGYSGGAALAAQLIIKDCAEHPMSLPHERPFKFAVFINAASPLQAFELDNLDYEYAVGGNRVTDELFHEAAEMFLRPSALRKKAGVPDEDQPDAQGMVDALNNLKAIILEDGTPAFTDGQHGLARYNDTKSEILIDIPTLHIRSLEETRHNGLHLYEMCEPELATEYYHGHLHDFPRGRTDMKRIAELIREVAHMS